MKDLSTLLTETPFLSYTYSYPHKTVYRPFKQPIPLSEVWKNEQQDALFLYVHIPFCEMRCGFCNLFTLANPKEDWIKRYMETLYVQFEHVRAAVPHAQFARLAIGGGTPTQLSTPTLEGLFTSIQEQFGVDTLQIPVSCESSPATLDIDKLQMLKECGVDRLSIGVQSFLENETKALGRPQKRHVLERSLRWIKDTQFPTMNIDLIYGAASQTSESWATSLYTALHYEPEEIYLYPLYVRPLTGLGKQAKSWDDHRMSLYRQGRDLLLQKGYTQVSMRMFRRSDQAEVEGPVYRCQEDGMIGLGAGARSYTQDLHYCTEYAVGRSGVKAILQDFMERSPDSFSAVDYGYPLTEEDQKRRYIILSLLSSEGLCDASYLRRFGHTPLDFLPQLQELLLHQLATHSDALWRLTLKGFEYSDVIGPWLYSEHVRQLSDAYQLH